MLIFSFQIIKSSFCCLIPGLGTWAGKSVQSQVSKSLHMIVLLMWGTCCFHLDSRVYIGVLLGERMHSQSQPYIWIQIQALGNTCQETGILQWLEMATFFSPWGHWPYSGGFDNGFVKRPGQRMARSHWAQIRDKGGSVDAVQRKFGFTPRNVIIPAGKANEGTAPHPAPWWV